MKNKLVLEISQCHDCTDFAAGLGYGEDSCKHKDAPWNGDCISQHGIPDWCPRLVEEAKVPEKPVVLIINGFPQSGKDLMCTIAEDYYDTINYSTVDTVKDIADQMGWNGIKTDKNRDMLSALKDFYTEWFDGPYNECVKIINEEIIDDEGDRWADYIFMHVREPVEINRLIEYCSENNVECYAVFVERKDAETPYGNHADKDVKNLRYDCIIRNNGTKERFKENVLNFLNSIADGIYKKIDNIRGN